MSWANKTLIATVHYELFAEWMVQENVLSARGAVVKYGAGSLNYFSCLHVAWICQCRTATQR